MLKKLKTLSYPTLHNYVTYNNMLSDTFRLILAVILKREVLKWDYANGARKFVFGTCGRITSSTTVERAHIAHCVLPDLFPRSTRHVARAGAHPYDANGDACTKNTLGLSGSMDDAWDKERTVYRCFESVQIRIFGILNSINVLSFIH